jgi:hypothetical protein
MSTKSKDELIALLRKAVDHYENRPPGEPAFYRNSGLSKEDLWKVGIRNYGDLCELAGYERNQLRGLTDRDHLLESLANLALDLDRYPDDTDRRMERRRNPNFPSQKAFLTAQKRDGSLEHQLQKWCDQRPQYAKVMDFVEARLDNQKSAPQRPSQAKKIVTGYVYLFRYGNGGRDYKVGFSENPARRHSQISGMVPNHLRVVHVIETDDPRGIEAYWKNRFETKRVKGKEEIFRLEQADVAAFKNRKYQ